MKPNGRRRWRKWAKKNGAGRGDFADYRRFRRHGDSTYEGVVGMRPGVVPSRPFASRSLVGMSMGARKRAARRWLWPEMNRKEALQDFREMIAEAPGVKFEYKLERRRYRIGQRLRPCPGCFDCGVECWGCHNPHEPDDECCGETGVIRAGRLRPEKRIPACTRPF